MAIIEVGVDGFLFLLSMSIQLDNLYKLDPVFLNDELARIENKEGVNFMLYYQSGGPKNKGEVLEDENRMILLRLPKKVGFMQAVLCLLFAILIDDLAAPVPISTSCSVQVRFHVSVTPIWLPYLAMPPAEWLKLTTSLSFGNPTSLPGVGTARVFVKIDS
ncbi:hypothetical protein NC653_024863 [Populus alba x Populus x berolinensis]|uniref:Uncharacterized protein n=1 Tax=Populus alba x Populus x berolinensis TaxID=444605 RepID=A0AAD6Q717_9ROSI|nr:hypothetical protein NC653_024854 [Populus alba x Populus x berolinensis]KAJ6981594.1 hypothetical protein NC653_024863 [Populus alba x Populus x berolinensis]